MADFNSELPVKTVTNGDVAVKIVDGTTVSQAVAVDASGNLSTNLGKVAGTAVDTANGTTTAGTQRVTISSDSTGQVKLATGANTIGALTANQSVNTAQVAGTTTDTNNGTTSAGTQRVTLSSDSTGQVKLATGANTIGALTSHQSTNVDEIGGAALALGQAAMAASIPVVIASNQSTLPVSLAASGTLITNPNTATAIAANATSNHTYSVTAGKTFTSGKFFATASGRMKIVVSLNGVATYWGFNSTANPNINIDLGNLGATVAATLVVQIARTNLDNQSQDVYSTIIGTEA